ncbi:proline iminopeptidase [Microbacterium sp. cf046]|uniref:alpha/beta fold hydrolase n=1 Tax=Microbacterium sp. cf046 TaxID=1761803 RepID=UPI0008E0358F|nr:alpha/beta fold hydrolase [Microbacterium sp. cf046]SFR93300.1 proline iminopeptidase [Microbacterium sp. cf046]
MHPPIEPFEHGFLDRPDGARLYWELAGVRDGRAALYLHGGPGSGLGPGGYRRRFDPSKHLIVGFDQRGCGRSTPWAIDDRDALETNTTQAMIGDIEALRTHLGIHAWLVHGVSWGSTLALAYALEHPDRVTELVVTAVTSGSREEIDWITEGIGAVFPEAWERLAASTAPGERVIDAYARLLRDPSPGVRAAAAARWEEWEGTHVSLDPSFVAGPMFETDRERENFATLVTHYWSNDCFLVGHARIRDRIGELAGTPGVLIHGRRDISGPAITPWLLHRAWPGSILRIVETEGHGGDREMELTAEAIDEFAAARS